MARTIFVGGRPIRVDENATEREVRQLADVDNNHFLAVQNPGGQGYDIFNERLPQGRDDLQIIPLPKYTQGGFDTRKQRVLKEASIVSKRYVLELDDENLDYFAVKKFPLNKHFSQSTTTLLIKIPAGYPETPPIHFFLKKGITYKGRHPSHYFEDHSFNELRNLDWSKYCIHLKSWRPSSNILDGDSLITYLELIKTVLDNLEIEKV